MLTRFQSRVWMAPIVLLSLASHASSLSDVVEVYRQNRYGLRNGAGSYQSADPADRTVIQAYYAELESAALLSPMAAAFEATAANSQAMIVAIQRAISQTNPISKQVETCLGSRDLPVHQAVLNQTAKSARAQLELSYGGRNYSSPVELDLDGTVRAYNVISGRDWSEDFINCCREEANNKLNQTDRTSTRETIGDTLRDSNASASQKLSDLIKNGGCERVAENIATEQTKFATHTYALPSRVIDPLEGLKMSPVEIATMLRSSSVRSSLRRIREEASGHSPTSAMFAELSYFEEIDTSCKKAKEEQLHNQNSMFNTVAKIGLNATLCHILPLAATENWSTGKAQIAYTLADVSSLLPWNDLRCDPNETAAYRAQRPTDPNVVADKWGIPQIQNSVYLNRLRSMVPLTSMPIVRAPDGSVILPGALLGGTTPTRAQVEAQYLAQQSANSNIVVNSSPNLLASRQLGSSQSYAAASRLAFLSGSSGSAINGGATAYVRSVGRGLSASGAINGVRSLAGNIETSNSRAPQSASALKQSATSARGLMSSIVIDHKGRGLAAMSTQRSMSAGLTRGLVSRSIASKSSRVSAEWIANILKNQRTGNASGGNVILGNGGQSKVATVTADDKQQKIVDELMKANETRRQALVAQADSMVKSIQNAVSRSGEIVSAIQAKIQSRDVIFNKTVEDMIKKPPKTQYTIVKNLITQDAARMQEIGVLKAEYDSLAASIPMLTNSLNRLGGLAPQIQTQVGSSLSNSQFATIPTAGADGRFAANAGTSVFAPATTVAAPSVNLNNGNVSKAASPIESFALKLLLPEAWALAPGPGTADYERRWSQAYDAFAADWDQYVVKLRDVEQSDRKSLVGRFRDLTQAPNKLALREPDAATFSLMWETMEVISEESKLLLQRRRAESGTNVSQSKTYQDVEVAQIESDKTIDLLAEWAQGYTKSAPKSYFDDPQVWEMIVPDAVLY